MRYLFFSLKGEEQITHLGLDYYLDDDPTFSEK
jgi:hypothetical protein